MKGEIKIYFSEKENKTIAKTTIIWEEQKAFKTIWNMGINYSLISNTFPISEEIIVSTKLKNDDIFDKKKGEEIARLKLYRKYHNRVSRYTQLMFNNIMKKLNVVVEINNKHADASDVLDRKLWEIMEGIKRV